MRSRDSTGSRSMCQMHEVIAGAQRVSGKSREGHNVPNRECAAFQLQGNGSETVFTAFYSMRLVFVSLHQC